MDRRNKSKEIREKNKETKTISRSGQKKYRIGKYEGVCNSLFIIKVADERMRLDDAGKMVEIF